MDLWKGKIAVVTGASAGIGSVICKDLCRHGVIVVGMARRLNRLNELKKEILAETADAQFYPAKCDLSKENEIKIIFEYVKQMFGGVDIMINNAGMTKSVSFFDKDNLDSLKMVIDTNLMGLVSCTKKAYESMAERDTPGYIINVSSVAGRSVPVIPGMQPTLNVYPSSKHALTALITVLRHELNYFQKPKIRASNISPGAVRTEIMEASGFDTSAFDLSSLPFLESKDISDAVLYLLGTNPRVQIEDFIIRPTGEMF